jgi:hypothetical protein
MIVLPAAIFAALVCALFAPPAQTQALARSVALAISALIARAPGGGSRRSRSPSKDHGHPPRAFAKQHSAA